MELTPQDKQIIQAKYNAFMEKYRHLYSDMAIYYIEEYFWKDMERPSSTDLLMQIYEHLGIYDILNKARREQNEKEIPSLYQLHLSRIEKLYDISGDVLDIASGWIPAFAEDIAYHQKQIGKGTITIYEPGLLRTRPRYKNMKLYKREFTGTESIKEFDLVTAILPCEATKPIIESACQNDIDFYVATCGCEHDINGRPFFYSDYESYQDYIINLAEQLMKNNPNRELVVDQIDSKYMDYPVLYTKKK